MFTDVVKYDVRISGIYLPLLPTGLAFCLMNFYVLILDLFAEVTALRWWMVSLVLLVPGLLLDALGTNAELTKTGQGWDKRTGGIVFCYFGLSVFSK